MSIPAFSGCTKGSYCSQQARTPVGNNKTNIYHRTVTTITGQGPAYSGSKTETYIISKDAAGIDKWVLAATTTDGGKTQTFTNAAGADLKKSMAPGGDMYKNTTKQVQDTLAKGGEKQGVVGLPGQSGSLEKINVEQQKKLGIVPQSTATSAGITTASADSVKEDLRKEQSGTRNKFSTILQYPENLQIAKQDVIKFSMVKYSPKAFNTGDSKTLSPFNERREITNKNIIGIVTLPIPGGISDTNMVEWGSDSVNVAEANFAGIANAAIGAGGGAGAEATGNKLNAVAANADAVKEAVKAHFVSAATGLQNPLSRTQGAVLNPNMELLFNGPQLRPFNFTFKLSPRSEKEAKSVRSIIRFFKQGMSPIRTESNLFLKAPHTFQIQYLHKNKEHKFINKIKECALQSFVVNYTPEGNYATFTDGAMVSYEIQMQFQELEPIFNDDYKNAENAPDTEIGF